MGKEVEKSGVCPVITIESVCALVTPHFAYLRVSGVIEAAFTVISRGKYMIFKQSVKAFELLATVNTDWRGDSQLDVFHGNSITIVSTSSLTCII